MAKIQALGLEYGLLALKAVAIFVIGRYVAKILANEVTERVKKALDIAGISIPFPQRDVHVFNNKD